MQYHIYKGQVTKCTYVYTYICMYVLTNVSSLSICNTILSFCVIHRRRVSINVKSTKSAKQSANSRLALNVQHLSNVIGPVGTTCVIVVAYTNIHIPHIMIYMYVFVYVFAYLFALSTYVYYKMYVISLIYFLLQLLLLFSLLLLLLLKFSCNMWPIHIKMPKLTTSI